MKAWQFVGTGRPLTLNDVAEPEPGPGEVVIDVRAAGLCHSDITYITSPMSEQVMPYVPMTQGHETAGVISAIGPDVEGFQVGDRVGVCPSGASSSPGMFRHGGFADKHVSPAVDLARIPERLDWSLGAVATDAGMTSYHAIVERGGLQAGMKVGVIGIGGLGQIAAQVAVVRGAHLHVADPKPESLDLARSIGAEGVVADADEWAGQDFDLVVDYAGFKTTGKALRAVRMGGTVVQVGIGDPDIEFPVFDLLKNKSLLGSMGGTVADIEAVYALMLAGDVTPRYEEIGFEDIAAGLGRLERAEVTGRLVARFGD